MENGKNLPNLCDAILLESKVVDSYVCSQNILLKCYCFLYIFFNENFFFAKEFRMKSSNNSLNFLFYLRKIELFSQIPIKVKKCKLGDFSRTTVAIAEKKG